MSRVIPLYSLMQAIIDTGVRVIKMVKPYRNTELIHQKVRDAERCGAVAVGMDIDHFYGSFHDGRGRTTETFGPQPTGDIKQLISETELPFIIKGVLNTKDAVRATVLPDYINVVRF
jgi:4-hydroxymandelate oxidase